MPCRGTVLQFWDEDDEFDFDETSWYEDVLNCSIVGFINGRV